ncbi:MAG: glycine cleavage system aminomethyltransferase GcvT [Actinomycetota bacterium]|nr:glycine cleavage system aminomethyltransferase GcvT [Actinomycetota bacterium]
MSDSTTEPRRTSLFDWHKSHGGTIVDFAGWEMPIQYETGAIAEHLATRRGTGLFDVAHMGRYRFRGPGALDHLGHVLTNDPRGLNPGEAHYTFIGNEDGGAVDDAYLYCIGEDDFLLVVNADNRKKDWDWIAARSRPGSEMTDVSDELGMISVQGPTATDVLLEALGDIELPENKRNQLCTTETEGHRLIIARTGYTGEASAFEVFPEADFTVELWERLVAAGGVPNGLGARDSLRLEAGLPLYGHELGVDIDGRDIPLFANSLATWGVRGSGDGFTGHADLARQRAEYELIKRDELTTPPQNRRLTHLVQPIAVFDGRKPLRAGYRLLLDGEEAGYITSGTSVPYTQFDSSGIDAVPSDEQGLRPVGLALVRSDIRYRSDIPVVFEVIDTRGRSSNAELVQRNVWPTAPYVRPYPGFEMVEPGAILETDDLPAKAKRLRVDSEANTRWRREECINLIPSEQCTSPFVDELCRSDPAGRYNEHNRLKALGPNAADVRYYQGTGFITEREDELRSALRAFFGCSQVEPRVISGQMANDAVYDALKQFRNRFHSRQPHQPLSRVLVHDLNKGGHLSAQIGGALKNYVAMDPRTERPAVEHFPMRDDLPFAIDVDATKNLIAETNPDLIVFGRSVIIHKEPVAPIAAFVHEHYGVDNPDRPLVMYDGAHVLGLLGPYFQDPLAEGADVITGSTHKSYFGPQRGVILSNIDPGSAFEGFWRHVESRTFPGHVSNHHLGTLLGLLGATYEMLEFRDQYPPQVIANARAFATALRNEGLSIEGDPANGFTDTHQVVLRVSRAQGVGLAEILERNNVITNSQALYDDPSFTAASGIRTGTSEMTRYGMVETDFEALAPLIAEIVRDGGTQPDGHWADAVTAFRSPFREMGYTL